MTSVAAWSGVDSRKPSSIYFASDSRLSTGKQLIFDHAKKTFASTVSPDILAYAGKYLFPTTVLSQLETLFNQGIVYSRDAAADSRIACVSAFIQNSLKRYHFQDDFFSVFYATRVGEKMEAKFHFWVIAYDSSGWSITPIEFQSKSVLLASIGSGPDAGALHWNEDWPVRLPGTSRSVFQEFCSAIREDHDRQTGGAPQLVGLYRIGPARVFGVPFQDGLYVAGQPINRDLLSDLKDRYLQLPRLAIIDPESKTWAT